MMSMQVMIVDSGQSLSLLFAFLAGSSYRLVRRAGVRSEPPGLVVRLEKLAIGCCSIKFRLAGSIHLVVTLRWYRWRIRTRAFISCRRVAPSALFAVPHRTIVLFSKSLWRNAFPTVRAPSLCVNSWPFPRIHLLSLLGYRWTLTFFYCSASLKT